MNFDLDTLKIQTNGANKLLFSISEFLQERNNAGRPWTKTETHKYKDMNDELLIELNKTLRPSPGPKTGKIGIFCPGQAGDLCTVMSVLKYADELWPGKEIIFFTNFPNADSLRYSNVSQVRPYPWAGNGLPAGTPDFYPLLCQNNRLNKEEAKKWAITEDLEDGFFPTPWMVSPERQHGIAYPNVSKMIFGVAPEKEWHPFLNWSEEEWNAVRLFMDKLPRGRYNILLETFCGSGQSAYWDEQTTRDIMSICRDIKGECNFIFASHKHKGGPDNCGIPNEQFFDGDGCVSAAHFTVRQAALLNDYCDLMVCMSSGISVSTSAWGLRPTLKLQYCGSEKCSTTGMANGQLVTCFTDGLQKKDADRNFYESLKSILKTI